MQSSNLVNKGNSLRVDLKVNVYQKNQMITSKSPEFVINGLAVFQLKFVGICLHRNSYSNSNIVYDHNNLIFVRFAKQVAEDDLNYTITFTSNELGVVDQRFTSDDMWRLLHENTKREDFKIDVTVLMDVLPCARTLTNLHEDTMLTDFELRGTDGAVRVHRTVLAAASPVFHRMLSGEWRETAEGNVEVSGTTRATLQHLKDYLYVHTLPESGLEQLLLFSSCYMMPDLEQKCVAKLVHDVNAANACDMIKFAATHNLTRLLFGILQCVKSDVVSLTDMRMHYHSTPALGENATNMK